MGRAHTAVIGILALVAAFAAAPEAHADQGKISLKNCDKDRLTVDLYDWGDTARGSPSNTFWVEPAGDPHDINDSTCWKNWWNQNSPGCWVELDYASTNGHDYKKRRYSGSYTVWQDFVGHVQIRSGYPISCGDDHFFLTGSVLWGCTNTPELTIYGDPNKGGDAYTLQNFSMGDLRRSERDGGSMNDWIRAMELRRGRWLICEHTGYGGECYEIWGDGGQLRFDTDWNGEWDKKISSIRPLACD